MSPMITRRYRRLAADDVLFRFIGADRRAVTAWFALTMARRCCLSSQKRESDDVPAAISCRRGEEFAAVSATSDRHITCSIYRRYFVVISTRRETPFRRILNVFAATRHHAANNIHLITGIRHNHRLLAWHYCRADRHRLARNITHIARRVTLILLA